MRRHFRQHMPKGYKCNCANMFRLPVRTVFLEAPKRKCALVALLVNGSIALIPAWRGQRLEICYETARCCMILQREVDHAEMTFCNYAEQKLKAVRSAMLAAFAMMANLGCPKYHQVACLPIDKQTKLLHSPSVTTCLRVSHHIPSSA